MPLTINREQRDAIYELVLNHLTGIGDVWIEVENRQFAAAKRLGRDFAEDLRLLEDLGWADTTRPRDGRADLAARRAHAHPRATTQARRRVA